MHSKKGLAVLTAKQRHENLFVGDLTVGLMIFIQHIVKDFLHCAGKLGADEFCLSFMELAHNLDTAEKADVAGSAFGALSFCFLNSISQNRKNIDFGK